ncbi:MAG: phosphohistidine phosphatase SixA [bacterium]|jgi:phosphohistidine phosphatase|nr:phosphohistidine phosphatase SixA [candidate division KSB1 bacterium]MDH7561590.1 phosphohistidine phosphatase SixA [bacterium]
MAIFLVQHGKSLPEEADPKRHLSPEGAREVERMAAWAQRQGLHVGRIVHSGKQRARQTAELFASMLHPPGGVEERSGLAPLDDPRPVVAWLEKEDAPMLVGHLPFLSRLAALLVAGTPEPPVVSFTHGGIVCLDSRGEGSGWLLAWAVTPALVE